MTLSTKANIGTEHNHNIEQSKKLKKAATACFIGNFVEWFDYAAYGYLAAVIAVVFFPSADGAIDLMSAYAVFALSFVVRPIGGIFWGYIGDKFGRRPALSWSILIMTVSTFCIALLPSHQSVGYWAPVGLLVLRMIQGFSASGEYAGAATFLAEYAPQHKRGFYTSLVPASTACGLFLGSLMVAAMYALMSTETLHSWGWRIPFLLAAPLGLIGRYIRLRLEETPDFAKFQESHTEKNTPIVQLFRHHRKAMVIAFTVSCLNAVGFYLILSYMPTYLSSEMGMNKVESFISTTLSLLTYIGFIFFIGKISDKVGRKKMLIIASVIFIVGTVPLFMLFEGAAFWSIVAIQIAFGFMLAMNDGNLPALLSELFPTDVRYSGFAFTFNTAQSFLGGTSPLIATWLIHQTHSALAPAWYLMAVAAIALVALFKIKKLY
ncbi:MFS transporter [Neisseriaceae bacterium CLB008]